MDLLGVTHFGSALVALAAGAAVLLRRKGDRRHRRTGWIYAASMLVLNGTALMLYRLTGAFGPFHAFAILSLITVGAGVYAAATRRPRRYWVAAHAYWMAWSYVGLLAAAASETLTRWSPWGFWWAVAFATLAVGLAGKLVIDRRMPATLQPFGGKP